MFLSLHLLTHINSIVLSYLIKLVHSRFCRRILLHQGILFFLQIASFGTAQFLHRPVAMQEGEALCKAPPFIKNEWLACHFFQKLLPSSQTPRAFQAKKWVRNASVTLRKTESFFCHLHLKKFSKHLLFQLKPKFKVKIIYFHIKRADFQNCSSSSLL